MHELYLPEAGAGQAIRALCRRSDRAGATRLGAHLAALGATGALVLASQGSVWLLPGAVLHGVVLVFLFSPLHECVHRTAFAHKAPNEWVATCAGFLLLLPRDYFRAFHLAHHRFTQDPDRDPELGAHKPRTRGEYWLLVSGLPYWWERSRTLIAHALGRSDEPFITSVLRPRVIAEARLVLSGYALLAAGSYVLGSAALFWLWLLPAVLGQPALRLFLLAEHTGCPEVSDMLCNTRTTRTNGLLRLLCWNMAYHVEHHVCPAVPFHGLPAAHELLKDDMECRQAGYLAFHRSLYRRLEPHLVSPPQS